MTAICIAVYFGIPVLAIWISGRQITWQVWIFMLLLWPIAWMIMPPEELP